MPLLMGLCDRIYAMESGAVIAEGTPEQVRNDPRVIASYLGTNDTAINRSGKDGPPPTSSSGGTTTRTRRPRSSSANGTTLPAQRATPPARDLADQVPAPAARRRRAPARRPEV